MPRDSRAEPSPPAAAATGNSFLDGKIGSTEAAWLGGALSLSERKVEQIMTAMDDVVGVFEEDRCDARARPSLPAARPARRVLAGLARRGQPGAPRRPLLPRHSLDFATMLAIYESGHTRIPIFRRSTGSAAPRCAGRKWAGCEVVGLLSTKDLILLDPEDGLSAEVLLSHCGRQVFTVWFDHPVNKMFADFKHRHTHLAFVQRVNDDDEGRDPFYELQGIVTLEDVLEELIQAEIVDESDVILDNVTKKPVQVRQGEAARRTAWHNMLDPKQLGNKTLSPVELEALSSFLAANVSAFAMDLIANPNPNPDPKPKPDPNPNPNQVSAFAMDLIAPAVLQELLGRAAVRIVEDDPASIPALSLEPSASRQGGAATTPLYRRGQQCGHCTVVLQGRLHIFCGEEGFESDRGPWTVLGAQSLQDEHYVADFSATPMERSRVLQISYADYQVGAPTGLPRSLACHTYARTLPRARCA